MSTRVYIDNNFFDAYEGCVDAEVKRTILSAFKTKKLSFYPSIELLSEMTRILETKRASLLENRKNIYFDLEPTKIFNNWNHIIVSELCDRDASIFFDNKEKTSIESRFRAIKAMDEINEMSQTMENNKKHFWNYYKGIQNEIRAERKAAKSVVTSKDFEDFNKRYMDKHLFSFVEEFLIEIGEDSIFANQQASKISKNIGNYAYFNCLFRIITSMLFKYLNEDRKVTDSDFYDAIQLIYMVGLDVLITEDSGMNWLCGLIFKKQKRVIAFDRVVAELTRI